MNFLLIDIGYDCEELNEPLGIETLSSFLKNKLPEIHIDSYCANCEGRDYFSIFNRYKPDIIGVSAHISTWKYVDDLYVEYLSFCEGSGVYPIILVGGILGTYEYEILINKYKNVICSIGEGEESLLQVLKLANSLDVLSYANLLSNKEFASCVNVAYKCHGKVVRNSRRCISSFDNLSVLTEHKYLKAVLNKGGIARVEASRGCPWNKCSFCVLRWKYAGEAWRPYSWDKVIPEIIDVASQGAKAIYFTDEEFLAGNYHRLQVFIEKIKTLKSQEIIDRDLEFVASTSTQALLGKYSMSRTEVENCLLSLKEIGFRSFFLGIESGSDMQLLRFRKGSTVKDNEDAILLLKKHSLEADIGYILFDPLLSVSELSESLDFLKRNGLENHISRFAKRLRLVPHTAYCNYPGIQFEQYDHNAIEFTYKFKDPKVQKIFDCYSNWEVNHISLTHSVQAAIRATESSSEVRNDKIERLSAIRQNEYEFLRCLVELAQTMPNFCEQPINTINTTVQLAEFKI